MDSIVKLRKQTKGETKKAGSNQTSGADIRAHAKREITEHYGQSFDSIKKGGCKCPICKQFKVNPELMHLLEIKSFEDDVLLGVINHITNLLPEACGDCHRFFDDFSKMSPSKFQKFPMPKRVEWWKHRIKCFEASREVYKDWVIDTGYESPIDYDYEINRLKKKIKVAEQNGQWLPWDEEDADRYMESSEHWCKSQPKPDTMERILNTTLKEFEDKVLDEDGNIRGGSKRFDKTRGPARQWYRYLDVPHKCIIPGCGRTRTIEVVHTKELSSYPPTATASEFNSVEVTAPLCKNHHRLLDGSEAIRATDEYKKFKRAFDKAHKKFVKKYKNKA